MLARESERLKNDFFKTWIRTEQWKRDECIYNYQSHMPNSKQVKEKCDTWLQGGPADKSDKEMNS